MYRLKADDVLTFTHIHRHKIEDTRTGTENQSPAKGVHVDATGSGALGVLHLLAKQNPALEPYLQFRRTQLINIWLPIKPVLRDPLGVVDSRTVDYDKDVVEIRMSKDGIPFSTCMIRENHEHKWYYRSMMEPSDALLLKIADCEGEIRRTGNPHASFHIPGTEDQPARESIEIRSYVFYK